jgi:hypothetical protein
MNPAREWTFREIVACALILMFGYVLARNPHDGTVIGAALTAFATAYGFYLGGSKTGTDTATKNADTVSDQAKANNPLSTEPQPVTVVNPSSDPVQTEEAK